MRARRADRSKPAAEATKSVGMSWTCLPYQPDLGQDDEWCSRTERFGVAELAFAGETGVCGAGCPCCQRHALPQVREPARQQQRMLQALPPHQPPPQHLAPTPAQPSMLQEQPLQMAHSSSQQELPSKPMVPAAACPADTYQAKSVVWHCNGGSGSGPVHLSPGAESTVVISIPKGVADFSLRVEAAMPFAIELIDAETMTVALQGSRGRGLGHFGIVAGARRCSCD